MLLKLKNDELNIKGRGLSDEIKQHNWLSKEDTSYPTMSNEDLMLLYMIDAMEVWDVATTEIPLDFLQTD